MLTENDLKRLETIGQVLSDDDSPLPHRAELAWLIKRMSELNTACAQLQRTLLITRAALKEVL